MPFFASAEGLEVVIAGEFLASRPQAPHAYELFLFFLREEACQIWNIVSLLAHLQLHQALIEALNWDHGAGAYPTGTVGIALYHFVEKHEDYSRD
mmetsp:Transcript_23087/g.28623  ORF Transcript_23087/g.28623 Transcript_23087/m.28623 type:complete len:95 (-) Transcript_23087:1574-1858(-)